MNTVPLNFSIWNSLERAFVLQRILCIDRSVIELRLKDKISCSRYRYLRPIREPWSECFNWKFWPGNDDFCSDLAFSRRSSNRSSLLQCQQTAARLSRNQCGVVRGAVLMRAPRHCFLRQVHLAQCLLVIDELQKIKTISKNICFFWISSCFTWSDRKAFRPPRLQTWILTQACASFMHLHTCSTRYDS